MFKFRAPISTAITISFGVIVLLGYFIPSLTALRIVFLESAMVLAGIALLIGISNLTVVHWKKIQSNDGEFFSSVLLISLFITIGLGLYDLLSTNISNLPQLKSISWIFNYIQLPIAASLMAVLAVTLTLAATRLLGRHLNIISVFFVLTVLILLIGSVPIITNNYPIIGEIRSWTTQVPAIGGARGILFGIALGSIATGIRILMGTDRPYGG